MLTGFFVFYFFKMSLEMWKFLCQMLDASMIVCPILCVFWEGQFVCPGDYYLICSPEG